MGATPRNLPILERSDLYGKTAYGQRKTARAALEIGGVFRPEETRHNGLNGVEEAVLTQAGNHSTTESGEEDTDDETYVPENNPLSNLGQVPTRASAFAVGQSGNEQYAIGSEAAAYREGNIYSEESEGYRNSGYATPYTCGIQKATQNRM